MTLDRSYLGNDPLFCQQVQIDCIQFYVPYGDARGCGCIPVPHDPWEPWQPIDLPALEYGE